MMERHLHRRDDEGESFAHLRSNDAPAWLKYAIYAADKVGVSAIICGCMIYICFVSIKKMTESVDRSNATLSALVLTINEYHSESKEWRFSMLTAIRDLQQRIAR